MIVSIANQRRASVKSLRATKRNGRSSVTSGIAAEINKSIIRILGFTIPKRNNVASSASGSESNASGSGPASTGSSVVSSGVAPQFFNNKVGIMPLTIVENNDTVITDMLISTNDVGDHKIVTHIDKELIQAVALQAIDEETGLNHSDKIKKHFDTSLNHDAHNNNDIRTAEAV